MSKIIFCDNNQENINKINSVFETINHKTNGIELVTYYGDIIKCQKENNGYRIATASNPSFNPGGGLDLLLANKFPNEWKQAKTYLATEHLYFLKSVDETRNSSKLIIKSYLSQIIGRNDLNLIFTSVGTGIGQMPIDIFCNILEKVINQEHFHIKAIQESPIIGFKSFEENYICREYNFKLNNIHEQKGNIILCNNGFHFCDTFIKTLKYYSKPTCIAEVKAWGKINWSLDKISSQYIVLNREISKLESYEIGNIGSHNTGYWNTGNRNTGNCNAGNCNIGDWNTGNYNTGDSNTGNHNTGDKNTGDKNTGSHNTGDRNTGDWNASDYSNGAFTSNKFKPKRIWFEKSISEKKYQELMLKIPNFMYFNQIKGKNYQESFLVSFLNANKSEWKKMTELEGYNDIIFQSIFGVSILEQLDKIK